MTDDFKLKLSLLPDEPGVYRYRNREGTIIYVGKAKNLKRRVNSYFNREHASVRTTMLVRNIADLEYTVVNTEEEALDLENALIKEFQPRYNVLLKDDKSYPWICISGGLYPRVYITREARSKGDRYYGPYPRAEVAKVLIDTIREIYPLRTCRLNVSRETIEADKHRLCLQYHIHHCEGCCKGLVSEEQYGHYISEIRQILNGDTHVLMDVLLQQMQQLAGELRFEEAELIKRRYKLLEHVRRRSVIVSPSIHNIDVFGLLRDDDAAWVNGHLGGGGHTPVEGGDAQFLKAGDVVEVVVEPSFQSAAVERLADGVVFDQTAYEHHGTRKHGGEAHAHLVEDDAGEDEEEHEDVQEGFRTLHGAESEAVPSAFGLHEVLDGGQNVHENVAAEHGQGQQQQGNPPHGGVVSQGEFFCHICLILRFMISVLWLLASGCWLLAAPPLGLIAGEDPQSSQQW